VDGQTLTLSASGWTYFQTFVLFDYETESLWFCYGGDCRLTCVSGPHADRRMNTMMNVRRPWNKWREVHPDTKILTGMSIQDEYEHPYIKRDVP
jgi:hypothetical protein